MGSLDKKRYKEVNMKITRLLLIFPLCILLFFTGCGKAEESSRTKADKKIQGVETEEVISREIDVTLSAAGTVRALTSSTLSSKVMGNIKTIPVKEGDRVEQGQVVIEIESQDIEARIRQAEGALESAKASLLNAEAHYNRISGLFPKGASSRAQLDAATMQRDSTKGMVRQAEGSVTEARAMKQYAKITSPVSGVVARKMAEVGEQAAPGRPLMEIEDTRGLQFETFVPESILPERKIGESVFVRIDAMGDAQVKGQIAEMEASADPGSHSAKVKIRLGETKGVISGMYGKAMFIIGKRSATLVPQHAVIHLGQLTAVYAVDQDRVLHLRLVQTGKSMGRHVEVISGLKDGERIAVSKLNQIEDGMEISE